MSAEIPFDETHSYVVAGVRKCSLDGADTLLGQVANEFFERISAGEHPQIEQYAQEYPEIADLIRDVFPALCLARGATAGALAEKSRDILGPARQRQLGDFRIIREIGRGGMGVVYEAEQISLPRRVALKVLPFAAVLDKRQLQRFNSEARAAASLDHSGIVSVYSVGCERGVHYYAMQLIEGQTLAEIITELRQLSDTEGAIENGTSHGVGQIAGDLAIGRFSPPHRPLRIDEKTSDHQTGNLATSPSSAETERTVQAAVATDQSTKSPEYFRSVARLGIQAAEALDHAHVHGVTHRDIKPGNLMLDGEGRLRITDFGLARIETDAAITITGDILGTLRYMSPEQALAKRVLVDHRSDVYSLGVTLYELLSFEPPFDAADRQELLKLIAFEEPRRLRQLNRSIPAELETIIGKAIEKNAADRYETAQELADDLGRFLAHEPIRAKPPTLLDRSIKWSRRHMGIVWTALAASLAISAILATAAVLVAQSRQSAIADRHRAETERNKAYVQRNEAHLQQYYAEVVSAQTDLADRSLGRLEQKLLRHLPVGNGQDYRDWEWYYLFSQCHAEERILRAPRTQVFASWSPDGELIATAEKIWRVDTGECIRLFSPSLNMLQAVTWSPDSQTLAWGVTSDDSAIYLWDRRTNNIRELRGHDASVWALSFSPDGEQLASGSLDNTIRIWDWAEGKTVRNISTDSHVTDVAWSPDGKLITAAARDLLYVWDADSGDQLKLLEQNDHGLHRRISWSPDGTRLAVGTSKSWYLLNSEDWSTVVEQLKPFDELARSDTSDLVWSPSGDRLAVTDRTAVDIWNETGDQILRTLSGHFEPVAAVSWSPNGNHLMTSDGRVEIRVWDTRSPLHPPPITTGGPIQGISWGPHGETLISVAMDDLCISSWQVAKGERIDKVETVIARGEHVGILSPDRRLRAHLSDVNGGKGIIVRHAQSGIIHSIWHPTDCVEPLRFAWSPDSSKLAIVVQSTDVLGVECWDVHKEQRISPLSPQRIERQSQEYHIPTWSPDGDQVAVVGWGDLGDNGTPFWSSHVHVFDAATGSRSLKRPFGDQPRYGGEIRALAWSPDGHYLAQGTTEGLVEIIAVSKNAAPMLCKAHNVPIRCLAWSPKGTRLATAAADGTVKILEPRHGHELLTLRLEASGCSLLSWSPDGKQLAAADDDGVIRIWDASRGFEFAPGGRRESELAGKHYDLAARMRRESRKDHLRQSVKLAPAELGYRLLRGQALAQLGEFDKAAREFGAAIPERYEHGLWMARWQARALLGAQRLDAYRKLQASLVDAVRESEVRSKRTEIAWLGALVPDATEEFQAAVEELQEFVAEHAQECGKEEAAVSSIQDRTRLIWGAMLYRLKKYDKAQRILTDLARKLSRSPDAEGRYILCCTNCFLAMTRHQLGHAFQSQRILSEADDVAGRLSGNRDSWYRQVEFDTLRREAEALIYD